MLGFVLSGMRRAASIPSAPEYDAFVLFGSQTDGSRFRPCPTVYYTEKMANPKRSLPNAEEFDGALRQVLRVSKSDLNEMLAEEKRAKQGKPKPGPKPKRKNY
jgi:hypothetical protein